MAVYQQRPHQVQAFRIIEVETIDHPVPPMARLTLDGIAPRSTAATVSGRSIFSVGRESLIDMRLPQPDDFLVFDERVGATAFVHPAAKFLAEYILLPNG